MSCIYSKMNHAVRESEAVLKTTPFLRQIISFYSSRKIKRLLFYLNTLSVLGTIMTTRSGKRGLYSAIC